MATIDYTTGTQVTKLLGSNVVKAQNTLDFADTNCGAGDTCQALKVPAGAMVTNLMLKIDTTSTNTVTIGDGDDADGWRLSTTLSGAGNVVFTPYPATSAAYAQLGGKYYSAEDTIDLVMSAANTTGAVTLTAIYCIDE